MNISIFIDVKLNRNGVGSYFHDLYVFFKENNIDVKIYNPESITKTIGSFFYPGDKTQRMVFPSYREIENDIKLNRPNLLFFTFFGPITLTGMRIAKKYKIPYIYIINSNLKEFIDFYHPRGVRHFLFQKSSSYVEKKLIKNALHVITVNPRMNQIPERYNAKSILTLGTLIDSSFLEKEKAPSVEEIKSVLYFGRLAIEKKVDLFINTAKKLPKLNFSIAGDGPLKSMVQSEAANIKNLSYLGWISRKEIINTIDSHDMVVMPSSFESFGTVALEALSRGRIVLIGKNHGISEFEDLNKCVFNYSDYDSLDNAIKSISEFDSKKLIQISNEGYETVQEYHANTKLSWLNLIK